MGIALADCEKEEFHNNLRSVAFFTIFVCNLVHFYKYFTVI